MKYKKNILLFLFFAFCITDCKKYPEGPMVSLRSKRDRLLGLWHVESFTVNGIDSMSQLICDEYSFSNGGGFSSYVNSNCYMTTFFGEWEFTNHKKNLSIHGSPLDTGKTVFLTSNTLQWEIQRLTEKQLWLKTNFNNKEYYNKFILIHN